MKFLDCIVTSDTPEVFIDVNTIPEIKDNKDINYIELTITNTNIEDNTVFVNSLMVLSEQLDLNQFVIDNSKTNKEINLFHIYFNNNKDLNLHFDIKCFNKDDKDNKKLISEYKDNTIYYKSSSIDINNITNIGNPINDNNASFMVLRTNPKLTGNIKLVVDSENKIYLDTFKASSILADKKFRKQEISGNTTFGNDIYNVFKDLPKGELYKLNSENYSTHNLMTEFDKMYDHTYNYGASNNTDELYSENFTMLAPLWINQKLPDFFAIFKLPEDIHNGANISNKNINSDEIFREMLKDGKLVKLYDMRESSVLGKYLKKHLKEIEYIPGNVYLQFKEQELKQSMLQGENSWTGIAVDKGLITTRKETSYISNKILNNPSGRQEKFNMFLTNGFERNNLISSNLINLEYKFNDIDSEVFKMNRYFGLYLTENQFLEYKYVATNADNEIQKFDEDGNFVDDSILEKKENIFENPEFSDRLLFALSPKEGVRLKSKSDIVNFINNNIVNRPYKNVVNTPILKHIIQNKYKEFITLNINSPINAGEHLRFIIPNYSYQQNLGPGFNTLTETGEIENEVITINRPLIIELIASNDPRLKAKNNTNYTDRMICNMSDSKYYQYDLDGTELDLVYDKIDEPIIYRIPFYVHSVDTGNFYEDNSDVILDDSILREETIDNQTKRIVSILKDLRFEGIDLGVINYRYGEGFISVGSGYDETYFQRISAYVHGEDQRNNELNDWREVVQDSITVYGKESRIKPTVYKLDNINKKTIKHNDKLFKYLVPDSFESYGNRYQYTVNFVKYNNLYEIILPEDLHLDLVTLYKDINNDFKHVNIFDINSFVQKEDKKVLSHHIDTYRMNNIQSPYDPNCVVVDCSNRAMFENGVINLYSSKPVQLAVMGMLSVKDFHYLDYEEQDYTLSTKDLMKLTVPKGEMIYIGSDSDAKYAIPENNIFKVTKGSVYGIDFKTADRIFTTFNEPIDSELFVNLTPGNSLQVSSDCEITAFNIMDIHTEEDTVINIKKMDITKFYEDIKSGKLLEPIVTPTVSYWEMIGTDHHNINAPLITSNIIKPIDNNTRNIGIPSYNFVGNSNTPHALSINNTVNYKGKTYTFKDYILKTDATNTVNRLVSTTDKFNTAIGYYNKNTETFEFILSGLKFNLRLNADQKDDNINLAVYNNYNVFLINSICDNKTNNSDFDIIIKTDEKAIIIINYKFDFFNNLYKQNLMINTESNLVYKNSDFYFDFNDIIFDNEYTYLKYYNGKPKLFDKNIKGICAQFDLSNKGTRFIDKVKNYGFYMMMESWKENKDLKLNENNLQYRHNGVTRIMNNFYHKNHYRDGAVFESNIMFNPSVETSVHKSLSYFLMDKENYTKYLKNRPLNRTYTEDNLRFDIENKNVTIYIKSEDKINVIDMDSMDRKLLIDIEYPEHTGYNYGYFTPRFVDKVKFFNKDTDINKMVNCDFDYCNTRFKNIKTINLYYNKIFNSNKHDITKGISIDKINNISLVSATWDNNYYRQYTDLNKFIEIQGYNTGVETKSFFSSKGIVIKNRRNDGNIILTNWNAPNVVTSEYKKVQEYETTQRSVNFDTLEIKFNLTLALYDYFIKNKTFVNNWKPFNYDVNSINNYIKYTMFKYYKINNKTDFKLYYMFEFAPSNHFNKIKPSDYDFNTKYKLLSNIDSDITFENNNYYCTVRIPDYKDKVFYATFDVKRNII